MLPGVPHIFDPLCDGTFRGITTGQGMCDLMLEEAKVMKGNRQLGQK